MNIREEFRKPEWLADWKIFLLFSAISFALAFGLRAMEFPKWDNPAFMVDGEYIMGTHDAYYWLAGAKGVGSAVDNPMAGMLRIVGSVTGAQYGNIAFWLPAVFAGFTAVAAFAWGMLVGGPWCGLVSAVFASNSLGFVYRTRLTCYDTDIVLLMFPLIISALLARWLLLFTKDRWSKRTLGEPKISFLEYFVPLIAGCVTSYGMSWHGSMNLFGVGFLGISILLGLLLIKTECRVEFWKGLIVYGLCAFWGPLGFGMTLICLLLFKSALLRGKFSPNQWLYLLFLLVIVLVGIDAIVFFDSFISKVFSYLKPVAGTVTEAGVSYPGIGQSVIEAQNVPINHILLMLTGSRWLSALGVISFIGLAVLRPSCLLLLPFCAFVALSSYLGGRFVMFGGVVVGVGLLGLAAYISGKFKTIAKHRRVAECIIGLVLLVVFSVPVVKEISASPITPIMGTAHVKALIESAKYASDDSMYWTWWDWGYATNYYTGKRSFADGGNHSGKILFPLAIPFSSASPMQANQVIKFSALNNYRPYQVWDKLGPAKTMEQILGFGTNKYTFPKVPKQFVVVTWENIRLAYWILYYGAWNTKTKTGVHPRVSSIVNPFSVNPSTGMIDVKGEGSFGLSSANIYGKSGHQGDKFANKFGPNLMFNQEIRQAFLLDDFTFNSMLVQLLLGDPSRKEFRENFKLVYDDFPNVRVFEIL